MGSSRAKGNEEQRKRLREDAEEQQSGGQSTLFNMPEGTQFLDIEAGKYYLDILPYVVSKTDHHKVGKGEQWMRVIFGVHRNVGPDNKTYICPKKTVNKKCPICEQYVRDLEEHGKDDESVKGLKVKMKHLYNVIDLDAAGKKKDKVQIMYISPFCFGDLVDEDLKEAEDEDLVWDYPWLKGGATLKVRFVDKKFMKTKYVKATKVEYEERDDYDEDILDETVDLDSVLIIPTYDELRNAFLDITDKDTEQNDDNEPHESYSSSSRRRSHQSERTKENDTKSTEEKDSTESTKDEDDNTSKRSSRSSRRSEKDDAPVDDPSAEDTEPECPLEDVTYGIDTDEYEDCENCEYWVACSEEKERKEKEAKAQKSSKKKSGKKAGGRRRN